MIIHLAALGGMAYWLHKTKGTKMTALEKTFASLVTQLLAHIDRIEHEVDDRVVRLSKDIDQLRAQARQDRSDWELEFERTVEKRVQERMASQERPKKRGRKS